MAPSDAVPDEPASTLATLEGEEPPPVTIRIKACGYSGLLARFVLPSNTRIRMVLDLLVAHGLQRRKIFLAKQLPNKDLAHGTSLDNMGPLVVDSINPNDLLHEGMQVGDCVNPEEPVHLLYIGSLEEDCPPLRARQEAAKQQLLDREDASGDGDCHAEPSLHPDGRPTELRMYRVKEGVVAVRQKPSVNAKAVMMLEKGQQVEGFPYMVNKFDPWLKIATSDMPAWVPIHKVSTGGEEGGGEGPEEEPQLLELLQTGPSATGVYESVPTPPPGTAPAAAPAAPAEPAAPPKAHPAEGWSIEDVCRWLKEELLMGNLAGVMEENGVDGKLLLTLSEDELIEELGLKKLQSRKIVTRLKELGQRS